MHFSNCPANDDEDESHMAKGTFGMFSLNSLDSAMEPEERLLLATCATLLVHYLRSNRYFTAPSNIR